MICFFTKLDVGKEPGLNKLIVGDRVVCKLGVSVDGRPQGVGVELFSGSAIH